MDWPPPRWHLTASLHGISPTFLGRAGCDPGATSFSANWLDLAAASARQCGVGLPGASCSRPQPVSGRRILSPPVRTTCLAPALLHTGWALKRIYHASFVRA